MPKYSLRIDFTNEQLETINATGSSVVLAKPNSDGGEPDVSWIVFKPFLANEVSWEENYGIYVSHTQKLNGATLQSFAKSPFPALIGTLYTFSPDGVISGPSSDVEPGSFQLMNKFTGQPYMTAGLYQNATANGNQIQGHPVTAEALMQNFTAKMTPYSDIYIWLQSQAKHSTVVMSTFSPKTRISFGEGRENITVTYNTSRAQFIIKR